MLLLAGRDCNATATARQDLIPVTGKVQGQAGQPVKIRTEYATLQRKSSLTDFRQKDACTSMILRIVILRIVGVVGIAGTPPGLKDNGTLRHITKLTMIIRHSQQIGSFCHSEKKPTCLDR